MRPYVSPLLLGTRSGSGEGFGVVVQFDIGGFTRAVEEYADGGPRALEALANLIDSCFDVIVDSVNRHGGAAHTFPGDGLIAVWEGPEDALYDVVDSARSCARELVGSFPTARRFQLKAGIGAGELAVIELGSPGARRELLVTGAAMTEAAVALGRAEAGKFVLSAGAQRHAPTIVTTGAARLPGYTARAPLDLLAGGKAAHPRPAGELLDFVPHLVRERLQAGLHDWSGEFRTVTTLFIGIGRDAEPSPALADEAYTIVHGVIADHDGALVQFCHDDKGLVCVAAFGVGHAHEDDADRAVRAAHALREVFDAKRIAFAAGVTTGRVYCGLLGGSTRREYRLIGRGVNLAARMMDAWQGVLCDEDTRRACRSFVFGESLTTRDRKGLVVAQRPQRRPSSGAAIPERFRGTSARERTCGRGHEIAAANAWLGTLRATPAADRRLLAYLGDAGVGKTQLASDLARLAQASGFRVVVCQMEEVGSGIALRAFRPLVEQLFDLGDLPPASRRRVLRDAVVASLGTDEMLPLLEDFYPLGWSDNATTAMLTGASRADNRLNLVAHLVQNAARQIALEGSPTLIFLEDAHWMDAASWALLDILCAARVGALNFVLTLRAIPRDILNATAVLVDERALMFQLGPLSSRHATELIANELLANQATPQLCAAILHHAGGNPLFTREIVRYLADQSMLVVERGTAHLVGDPGDVVGVLPDSVDKVVHARLDALPIRLRWVLNCASVFGVRFSPQLLAAMPPAAERGDVAGDLAALVERGLVERLGDDEQGTFAFRHPLVRDVAYASMLYEQRRDLHVALAQLLEQGDEFGGRTFAIFAHWRAAGESWRALRYVDHGGAAALREGDYRAAREFFLFGVDTLEQFAAADEGGRRARWSQHLGQALVALGRHAQARQHLETALRLYGEHTPRSRFGVMLRIVAETMRQVGLRRGSQPLAATAGAETACDRAEIHEQLGYVFYASGDTLRGVLAALAMLNRSELGPLHAVRARAYVAMSLTVSVTPLRRFGDLYEAHAYAAAATLDERSVFGWVDWIASLRAAGEGHWSAVFERTERAIEAGRVCADLRLVVMVSLTRAWALRVQGEIGEARQLARIVLTLAREHGNHLWEAWALLVEAECDLARQAYAAVIQSSQRALDILVEESDRTEEIRAGGLLAAALFAQGQPERARSVVASVRATARRTDLTSFLMLEGFAGVAEVAVGECERIGREARAGGGREMRREARAACAGLVRFARVFPIGRPRAALWRARLALVEGRPDAARTLYAEGIAVADALDMARERMLLERAAADSGMTTATD
ncbi:MAG: AAA family ATPase [Gammaproteobacteria bacterium]